MLTLMRQNVMSKHHIYVVQDLEVKIGQDYDIVKTLTSLWIDGF